jgi:hypothetical protein
MRTYAHIFLGIRAGTDAMAGEQAEGARPKAGSRAEEGRSVAGVLLGGRCIHSSRGAFIAAVQARERA